MNTLELARIEDLEICAELMREGRAFQQEQGFVQWTPDYPNRDTVKGDIEDAKGYVLKVDGQVSHFDTVTHKQIPTEKAVEYVVDCRCDRSVRDTTSGVHILDHLHELRGDWNLRELHRGRSVHHRGDISLYEICFCCFQNSSAL